MTKFVLVLACCFNAAIVATIAIASPPSAKQGPPTEPETSLRPTVDDAEQMALQDGVASITASAHVEPQASHEHIQIQVKAAQVGPVELESFLGVRSLSTDEDALTIRIEISNSSETKKTEYRSWSNPRLLSLHHTKLTDNYDNRYKMLDFGTSKVVGSLDYESIYPGKAIVDTLVFQVPIEKAEELRLDLPCDNFGSSGILRIVIPRSIFRSPAETRAPDDSKANDESKVTFFGREATGRRFAFVLDVSGSMGDLIVDPRSDVFGAFTKIDTLKRELTKCLQAMHDQTQFAVLLFSSGSQVLGDRRIEWIAATDLGKKTAKTDIAKIGPGGATDPVPSLKVVFEMQPSPEAIYLMTDGNFDQGMAVADVIKLLNAELRIPIHCISIGRPEEVQVSKLVMQRIANESGGTYAHVRGPLP